MENIEIYATAVGTIIVCLGVVFTMSNECKKQIGNVYRRFDQYKEHLEGSHVSKEVCGILHKQICEDIIEIKADIKKLLILANGKGRNGSS